MLTFSALSTKKLVLFPDLKRVKPLSVNALMFIQQALNNTPICLELNINPTPYSLLPTPYYLFPSSS
ncbi:hypothetical protein AFK68_01995 [Hydrocoleum sp. CS-953]|uniref:hypothetical protein n=1 Tax=Hydrocoleum sp. CS-953 TaxID=1671698 RepID=UPI000B9A3355|nr:hypothetical protein [Hydrocoleum sp. CS-953]OZH55836.1 hypothetical protein AFK68_01995 [Hydrocoleum sp. CS-953]